MHNKVKDGLEPSCTKFAILRITDLCYLTYSRTYFNFTKNIVILM